MIKCITFHKFRCFNKRVTLKRYPVLDINWKQINRRTKIKFGSLEQYITKSYKTTQHIYTYNYD